MKRRTFIFMIGAIAAQQRAARAEEADAAKVSKARVEYRDSPNGIAMCATCTLFEPPQACKIVAGVVSANGWCNAYAVAD